MSINYAVTKKVDKSKGIAKERYYATTALRVSSASPIYALSYSRRSVFS